MDEPNGASSISSPSPVEIDRYFDSSERLPGEIVSTELSRSLENALNLHPSNSVTNENTTHPGPKCHVNISDEKQKVLSRIATIKHDGTVLLDFLDNEDATIHFEDDYTQAPYLERIGTVDFQHRPPMQIVILIVGTRGDVQPFLAIAKRLKELRHRVRLATHANFEQFVLDAGVEFYPLGGDPKVLAEYMVKNKGFLPSHPSEVQNQRNQIKDIVFSMHSACTKRDPVTGAPFKVDAIIANPPAYGHEHVAEALNVPLHVFFTMPWTPTGEFAHPLSRIKHPPGAAGYKLSYYVVDLMIWLGIRDIINDFRKTDLKLESIGFNTVSENALNTPHGYIWSPSLVPKPKDWGPKVDVVGFCFLDLASNYTPPEELVKWLEAGEKPIYFGFGSLPVEEPEKLTETIVEALEARGQRGIINKGWGGLGKLERPRDFVYLLDNVPHDWLFLQCKAVVHHGGAGTTAAGLKAAVLSLSLSHTHTDTHVRMHAACTPTNTAELS
ncbi:sterol 3-beta-glucosyltransferase UGT80A2 isoform X2 [Carex littledalei]|uniref:Sterol 3-beta-glucosyltransferase UGT80A2 isoform X2 n=1 Tax=Carex littledalei TaxID=544730 RepID=A0A833QK75_9POAL|nr:sterol 3-beta-glucosyltransferase UGT80A2 isoform X2 [Carex littledalei]